MILSAGAKRWCLTVLFAARRVNAPYGEPLNGARPVYTASRADAGTAQAEEPALP